MWLLYMCLLQSASTTWAVADCLACKHVYGWRLQGLGPWWNPGCDPQPTGGLTHGAGSAVMSLALARHTHVHLYAQTDLYHNNYRAKEECRVLCQPRWWGHCQQNQPRAPGFAAKSIGLRIRSMPRCKMQARGGKVAPPPPSVAARGAPARTFPVSQAQAFGG